MGLERKTFVLEEDSSPLITIDCVIDNIDMFQFVRDFVKK